MKKKKDFDRAVGLRKKAEEKLQSKMAEVEEMSDVNIHKLLHELQVHQIELEMQNEELRKAQVQLEESRQRYADLYDFAPVGYLTLNENGLIQEANLTAARLLGVKKSYLLNKPFSFFIHIDDRDIFYLHLRKVFESTTRQSCEVRLKGERGIEFNAQLDSILWDDSRGNNACRTSVIDVTRRKQAEEKILHDYHMQNAINSVLKISLQSITLEEQLDRILDVILLPSFLSLQPRGHIYLVENKSKCLVMKVQRGMYESQLAICGKIPFGKCLCGQAASTHKLVFIDHVDFCHTIYHEGIHPHGHYCIPILSNDKLLGVICLYVDEGYKREKGDEEFLFAVANTLAGIIERKCIEEELRKNRDSLEEIVKKRTFELTATNEQLQRKIIEKKYTEEKLRQSAKVFESTTNGVIITDANVYIIAVNQAFKTITGYDDKDVLGKNPRILSSGRHDQNFYKDMWESLKENGQWRGEIWIRRKNGEIYPQWLNVNVVKNDKGIITNYVAVFSDISVLKESEEKLRYLAYRDPLTNLPNRLLFNDRLNHALEHANRHNTKIALLFLDLDNFKNINDSLGHPFGDQLLQAVAHRLRDCMRTEDTVARLGGDEFSIIVEDITISTTASLVARRIINAFSQSIVIEGHEIFITTSIGISIYPDDGKDIHTLIKHCDTAMYHAKKSGRNNYQFYALNMTVLTQERMVMENALRHALQRDEFVLHYQPQVDIDRRQIVGAEALIRWQHPEKSLIYPATFIPLAEEIGLISSIGEWVLYTACAQWRAWQLAGYPSLRIAVNISGRQFREKNIVKKISHILRETKLDPQFLELEITESILIENIEEIATILRELKAMGIQLAIDDFGTGYCSMFYLKRFPIDRLKIDRSFIQGIPEDSDDMSITNAIIAIACNLGINVIAEGVETEEQMVFLRSSYCKEIQGYIVSPPLPTEKFKELLSNTAKLRSIHS